MLHVSSNISCDYVTRVSLFFQLASPHAEGEPCISRIRMTRAQHDPARTVVADVPLVDGCYDGCYSTKGED